MLVYSFLPGKRVSPKHMKGRGQIRKRTFFLLLRLVRERKESVKRDKDTKQKIFDNTMIEWEIKC